MIGQDYLGIKCIRDKKRYNNRPLDMPQCVQEIKNRQTQQVVSSLSRSAESATQQLIVYSHLGSYSAKPIATLKNQEGRGGECLHPQQDSAHPRPHPFLTCCSPRQSCHAVGGKGRKQSKKIIQCSPESRQ